MAADGDTECTVLSRYIGTILAGLHVSRHERGPKPCEAARIVLKAKSSIGLQVVTTTCTYPSSGVTIALARVAV